MLNLAEFHSHVSVVPFNGSFSHGAFTAKAFCTFVDEAALQLTKKIIRDSGATKEVCITLKDRSGLVLRLTFLF